MIASSTDTKTPQTRCSNILVGLDILLREKLEDRREEKKERKKEKKKKISIPH